MASSERPSGAAATDDLALLRAARAGERAAFGALAERHGERLRRYVAAMTGDDAAAEDVRQDALRLAFERLDQLDDDARFDAWLLSIAINRCRQHLRAEVLRSARGEELLASVPARRCSALSSIVRRESAAQIALAIDRLPILLREAFVLFVVESLPYADIAALTGAAPNTLQVRVHRAKALLRQQLGDVADTAFLRPL